MGLPKTFATAAGGTYIQSGTLAARPPAGVADRYYWATDVRTLYRDTGAAWEPESSQYSFMSFRRTGRYYSGQISGSLVAGAVTANVLWVTPFYCPKAITVDRIGIGVTVAAVGNVRLGIYRDDGDVYPGALLLDAGLISTNVLGSREIAIAQPLLENNLYHLVALFDATPTVQFYRIYVVFAPYGAADCNSDPASNLQLAFAMAPLPDPFPAGAAFNAVGSPLLISLRIA